ncbi:hypothetical protein SAMN04488023_11079 [Pedobacter rhizosphaerae]|uniref:Uncharacterized protein n=1 Tax=Pedobacter rhizosphaerae TaxID=390241 RepID=A0A1H9PRI5_9SPHI|nr:hypothetical protein SAMN04488023_11079 [Pedobacter rhizosphaerae]
MAFKAGLIFSGGAYNSLHTAAINRNIHACKGYRYMKISAKADPPAYFAEHKMS